MYVTIDLQFAKKQTVRILNICCIIQYSTDILGFIFLAFTNIQSLNSALYFLRSGVSKEVSLDEPLYLKIKN
jgi:hypothetical protein